MTCCWMGHREYQIYYFFNDLVKKKTHYYMWVKRTYIIRGFLMRRGVWTGGFVINTEWGERQRPA